MLAFRHRALTLAALGPAVFSGCYEYVPVAGAPVPGMPVALDVTDEGRFALRDRIGRDIDRIEGTVVSASDRELTLRMEKVTDLRGDDTKWNGEQVSFARQDLARTFRRRLDRVRTFVALGVASAAVLSIGAATRFLSISGGGPLDNPSPPPPPAN